jgi:hypothetical protein
MTYVASPSRSIGLSDHYLVLLSGALLGYAMVGKGFAYLGLPPLFIGEIALLTGFVVLLRTGCLIVALSTLPSLVLAAMMAWVLLRTLPFVGVYGFDALRDSVVIMYGGFAFIVIALLLEDGRRITMILRYYGAFLNIYIPAIPFVFAFSQYMSHHIPRWPGYNVPFLLVQSPEVAVHLAGASVFALVGFRKASVLSIIAVLVSLAMVVPASRGAMLAFVIPVVFAVLVLGKVRQLTAVLVVGLAIFAAAYAVEAALTDYREASSTVERSISARQIVNNVASIAGRADEQTEGTKTWRLDWWNVIINNTIYGPYFWTGRGFGLNLADADGFRKEHNVPALRSPHNVNMTVLARAGVPGAALWGLFVASWLGMLTRALLTARRHGQTEWTGLFLFIGCYVMSMFINATFDAALEGPMLGVWFWCLIGFGIGSVMVFCVQTRSVLPHRAVLIGSKRATDPTQEAP